MTSKQNKYLAYESADSGFQLGNELRGLCISIIDKRDEHKDHHLYEKALEVLNLKKSILEYQERHTQFNLLFLALVDDFSPQIVEDFIEEEKTSLHSVLDSSTFQQLYDDISYMVGEETMENLNQILKQKFIVYPFLSSFIQGFTNDVLYSLMSSDIETNKNIFQLSFDILFNSSENE